MTSQIPTLFTQTLAGNYDDPAPWQAVHKLHALATQEVLDQAVAWSKSSDPRLRARGADVLGQLSNDSKNGNNLFREERFLAISRILQVEKNAAVLASALYAIGHLYDARAAPLIMPSATHQDANVRHAVSCALGSYADDEIAVGGLIQLMEDVDAEVRDWATFGLGVRGSADSPRIRAALIQRLTDTDENVWEEAMVGLAKRMEPAVVPIVKARLAIEELNSPRAIEAASYLLELNRDDFSKAQWLEMLNRRFPGPAKTASY